MFQVSDKWVFSSADKVRVRSKHVGTEYSQVEGILRENYFQTQPHDVSVTRQIGLEPPLRVNVLAQFVAMMNWLIKSRLSSKVKDKEAKNL